MPSTHANAPGGQEFCAATFQAHRETCRRRLRARFRLLFSGHGSDGRSWRDQNRHGFKRGFTWRFQIWRFQIWRFQIWWFRITLSGFRKSFVKILGIEPFLIVQCVGPSVFPYPGSLDIEFALQLLIDRLYPVAGDRPLLAHPIDVAM